MWAEAIWWLYMSPSSLSIIHLGSNPFRSDLLRCKPGEELRINCKHSDILNNQWSWCQAEHVPTMHSHHDQSKPLRATSGKQKVKGSYSVFSLLLEEWGIAGLLCALLGAHIHFKRDVKTCRWSMKCLSKMVRDINHVNFEKNLRELYFFAHYSEIRESQNYRIY